MNRLIFLGVIGFLFSATCGWTEPGQFSERWEKLTGCRLIESDWNDGDSFHIRHNGKEYIFRLYYVDTPEVHDVTEGKTRTTAQAKYLGVKKRALYELADVAKTFSHERLKAAPFTVYTRWEDAKGASHLPRSFAVIVTSQGDLADLLIANGLARIHGHHLDHPLGVSADRYNERLNQLEEKARKAGLGAWGVPEESKRGVPATQHADKSPTPYRGSQGSSHHQESSEPASDIPAF